MPITHYLQLLIGFRFAASIEHIRQGQGLLAPYPTEAGTSIALSLIQAKQGIRQH